MADLSKPVVISAIDIALVDVTAGRRKLDPAWVETLADLFRTQGQKTPIEVIATGDRFRLVFGHHRLAAAKLIEAGTIAAIVKSPEDFASESDIMLAEITENLARRELSVLDRAVDIARWREVYEATHLLNKGGRRRKDADPEELSTKFGLSFSEAAQKAFRLSRASIFYTVKIASIGAAVRDQIALHAIADNQSELLALAAEQPARQADIAALLTSEPPQAGSVADAIAILDRSPKPRPEPKWQKLAQDFSKMKAGEQDRFFDLHEAAIQRWLNSKAQPA
ncbi:ParB N-terminal domain-containing protein [Mesorhizobium sp. M0678]|uniref:ParB/RepB/Spo0J family partition protein n=1 Tax=Mesorhizobium sp. M0678 TaxID=2956985 RepID=UPI003337F7D1